MLLDYRLKHNGRFYSKSIMYSKDKFSALIKTVTE